MNLRPLLLAAAIAAVPLAALHSAPAQARGYVSINVGIAPPPPRYERVVIRPGYVWSPGYWRWNGRRHVWVGGNYVPVRRGYAYVPARWQPYGQQHWRFHDGYWVRRR